MLKLMRKTKFSR